MAIKKTVYPHSADVARERGELDKYRESNKFNRDCAAAIDKAISDSNYEPFHYDLKSAMRKVTKAYGEKRVAWVMAATVQLHNYDGRYSLANKEWAKDFLIPLEQRYGENPRIPYYGINAHATLIDGFISYLREHLERVPNEVKRITSTLEKLDEPNSPLKTHFMVKVDMDFLNSASSRDTNKLLKAIPYKSAYLSNLNDQRGIFVFIKQDEILRARIKQQKLSVTGQLKKDTATLAARSPVKEQTATKKKTEQEL